MWKLSSNPRQRIRPAAVAGRFYPGQPRDLRDTIEDFLREARGAEGPAPKAIIAPHAGYMFSGPIAASAHARLKPARDQIRRIVLIGPAHYLPFEGLAASGAAGFATPLGVVPVDGAAVENVCARLPQVRIRDEAHAPEHALEVQLPFLQVVLAEFQIVPLLVGEVSDEQVADVIETLWGGDETRFVISSDLSHYHAYEAAHEMDAAAAEAIEGLRPEDLGADQACGRKPICGLLAAARHHGLRGTTLDLRNSGDTAGPRDRVVGYGAFAFGAAANRAIAAQEDDRAAG